MESVVVLTDSFDADTDGVPPSDVSECGVTENPSVNLNVHVDLSLKTNHFTNGETCVESSLKTNDVSIGNDEVEKLVLRHQCSSQFFLLEWSASELRYHYTR